MITDSAVGMRAELADQFTGVAADDTDVQIVDERHHGVPASRADGDVLPA